MIIKNVFDTIFSMENLQGALEDACRNRRYKKEALVYALNAYEKLSEIRDEVYSGEYTIDRYFIFYVYEPKKRMIMSISFRHRIVQWAIYRVINPMFVKGYISDSYGCVPGKGSLGAVQRMRYWMKLTEHKGGTWYYLKLDISKYFYRVSHRILKKILAKKIKDKRLMQVLVSIIDCDHTPFRTAGREESWRRACVGQAVRCGDADRKSHVTGVCQYLSRCARSVLQADVRDPLLYPVCG